MEKNKLINGAIISTIFLLFLSAPVSADNGLLVVYSFTQNNTNTIINSAPGINGSVASGRTAPSWVNYSTGGELRFVKNASVGNCIDTNIGAGNTYAEVSIFVCGINNTALFGETGNPSYAGGNFMHFYVNPTNHGARIYGSNDGTITFETSGEWHTTTQTYYGNWHCYAMACGNSSCDLYVDSTKLPETLNSPAAFDPSTNFHIGCRYYFNNQGETINADITEARIYSRKLNQSEITALVSSMNLPTTTTTTTTTSTTTTTAPYWCYQETATQSTSCGGLSTGAYSESGTWGDGTGFGVDKAYDGAWGEYSAAYSIHGAGPATFIVAYSKPVSSVQSSKWQIKDTGGIFNLSISSDCWQHNSTTINFKVVVDNTDIHNANSQERSTVWYCLGSSGWNLLRNFTGDNWINEEAMWWNLQTTQTTTTTTPSTTTISTTTTTSSTTSTTTTSTTTSTTSTTLVQNSRLSVSRRLPSSASAGSSFIANLSMDVNESNKPSTVGLTEYYPNGWAISNISFGGVLKTSPSRIEWLFSDITTPVQDRTISYGVTAVEGISGTYAFSGYSDLGSINITTAGDASIPIAMACTLAGDNPPCGEVSINEVVVYVNNWVSGTASLQQVIALINGWAAH